jgi:hypothetical protein
MRDGKPLHPTFFDDDLSEPKRSPVFTKWSETFTSVHRNILTGSEIAMDRPFPDASNPGNPDRFHPDLPARLLPSCQQAAEALRVTIAAPNRRPPPFASGSLWFLSRNR